MEEAEDKKEEVEDEALMTKMTLKMRMKRSPNTNLR